MTSRAKAWLLSLLTLAVFGLIAWLVGRVAGDTFQNVRLIQGLILTLGALAAATVLRFLLTRWKGRIRGEKAAKKEDRLASTFKAAAKRLAASPKATEKKLRKLPTVLVLGARASTKTTAVEQSGLDTELLAGETHRGDAIVPTEVANVWYAQGTVLVEAGGALIDEPERWEALLSHTQPARLAAALGLEQQAPRVAVVCVACDEFTQPGAAETLTTLARNLRDRLVEAAQALGIRLPVYVLFTRADRLPYYDDFVRALTQEDAARALGVTLPIPEPSDAPHAEREGRRIDHYLAEFLHSLRLKRRDFLMRERDPEVQGGMYEFPRELEKIRANVRTFLVELCRPSQLGQSPFLRSFHFTGVRALVVEDPGAAPTPRPSPTEGPAIGATAVFDMAKIQAAAQAAASVSRSRRVPDWAFLKPFFLDVLLPDDAARITTTGGARVDFLRRALLSVVALVGVVWSVGMLFSFRANRATIQRVEDVSTLVEESPNTAASVPERDVLERLDTLRAELVELRRHRVEGPPLGMRWGLYRGGAVLDPGLLVYLQGFEAAMGREARAVLQSRLAALPPEPGPTDEFRPNYDALKAYLILTDHPTRSTVEFLPDAVLASWDAARISDEETSALIRRQLDFFADVIRDGNPVAGEAQAPIVASSRQFLQQFGGEDQFYQSVLDQAGTRGEEIRLATAIPGSTTLLRNDVVVPAHFTLAAFDWVSGVNAEELLQSEDWVLGPQSISGAERAELGAAVKARYLTDYSATWLSFIDGTSVVGFNGPADASTKLGRLAGPDSPLLGALSLVSRNTQPLQEEFQPLHAVQPPPDEEEILIGETNQGYTQALLGLQGALSQVASAAGGAQQQALQNASSLVLQGEQTVAGMAGAFARQPDMALSTGAAVRKVLEDPIRRAQALVRTVPSAQVNGQGASFCSDFDGLLSGYPFDPQSPANADIEDVIAALQPGQSRLSSFIQDDLQGLVVRQGNRYVARSGADPAPSNAFLDFLNRAFSASEALFDAQGQGPRIDFRLIPENSAQLPEITVIIDGNSQRFTRTSRGGGGFSWNGATARDARVEARIGDEVVTLLEVPEGPWALFRLFELAQWEDRGGTQFGLRWDNTASPFVLQAELYLTSSTPIFQRRFLDGLSCVRRVVR